MKRKAVYTKLPPYKKPRTTSSQVLTPAQKKYYAAYQAALARRALRSGGYAPTSNREMKFVDVATNITNLDSSTSNVILLSTIPQGASQSQRIGRKAWLDSIQVKGRIYSSTTTTISGVRWALVYDAQTNKSAPVFTDVFNTATYDCMKRDDNKNRFYILKDNIDVVIGNSTTPATGRESLVIDCFVKINKPIEFATAGTGAIGDTVSGGLFLVSIGEIVAGTAAAFMEFTSRLRYKDM